ncbi:NAD(P)-dependent oxidoreductase [Priestia koreensis]|uniref:NAD(P)-dependent oxidoreductase n=1 Tax=Priestia koreensis TaxID=284581 RepID=UPI001F587FDC|nr:NAD(P)-dependent oxidoreductase [Priestia koreensis]MCM3003121.1 NAD(P)-dependent oxidoreductase [Priestia koreensis]UNL85929.1 NAD(P)-dependent oxidoreductase [Priestia koreensis]
MTGKQTVGFIGTGVMGKSMASHLMNAGHDVHVYTRTKEKAVELIESGAVWCETPKEVAQSSDVIITMVGYPSDVEEIYLGENGLLAHAKKGTYFIDMTTSKPSLAVQIHEKANEQGMYSLDAPVSGGDVGAREATLTIMVGGDEEAFQACKPILELLGSNVILQGDAGAGQHTKMCNQIAIASNMMGVSEAIVYAEKAGLNPESVLKSISSGAAGSWSLSNLAPRMIKGDFEPGFYIKHFIKDMGIALEEAEAMNMNVPGLQQAKKLYDSLASRGKGDKGTQALYELYK